MTKKKKIIISVISIAIAVLLITSLVIALVINSKREKTATTVMTCSVNPEVQFVLNAKNEVMKVVAINNDGQAVIMTVDFIGLDAEDAAEMFVKVSTEAGYINPATDGTAVNFYLSGEKKNYDKLKEKITTQVNEYFDKNGIIAGAVTNIVEDFKEAIKTLKPNAQNLDNKTQKELMENYLNITTLIEGIAPERLESFYENYNTINQTLETQLESLNSQIAEQQAIIDECKTELAKSDLPQALKDIAEEGIATAERIIKNLKTGINDANREFNIAYQNIIETAKSASESIYQSIKADMEQKLNATKTLLENRKTYFEANRAEVENKIAEFRATLNA